MCSDPWPHKASKVTEAWILMRASLTSPQESREPNEFWKCKSFHQIREGHLNVRTSRPFICDTSCQNQDTFIEGEFTERTAESGTVLSLRNDFWISTQTARRNQTIFNHKKNRANTSFTIIRIFSLTGILPCLRRPSTLKLGNRTELTRGHFSAILAV